MSFLTDRMVLISSNTLGTATTSITFSNIPSTYRALRLVFSGAVTAAVGWSTAGIRFNGDATSNYYHQLTSTVYTSTSIGSWSGASTGGSAANSSYSGNDFIIYDYTSTTRRKLIVGLGVSDTSTTSTPVAGAGFYYNLWGGNAAITSITLLDFNGYTLAIGAMAALYGMP